MDDNERKELTDSIAYYKEELSKAIENRQSAKKERDALKADNEKLLADIQSYKQLEAKINTLTDRVMKDSVREELITKHISESASKYNAYKPEQIPRLIDARGFIFDDTSKTFVRPVLDVNGLEVSKQSLDDTVKEFLDVNDHLVKSKLKILVSTPHNIQSTNHVSGLKNKRHVKAFKGLRDIDLSKVDDSDIRDADNKGLSIQDYLEIKTMKQKKLGRR
jgi:hypothetical protein